MKPEERHYKLYLEDMLLSMKRIEEYINGLDFVKFKQKYIIVDAVVRNFEIIGEAAKQIPIEIQEKYPEIPWKKMYGLRNLIIHEYFGLDYELIWQIAKTQLPQNTNDLERILNNEELI